MKDKFIYALVSILIAFGLWGYVVTVVSPESEAVYYNIPVVLSNETVLQEKGLMITSDSNPTVTVQLRGNRNDLNNLKNSDITVVADLSKINSAGEQLLGCNVSFAGSDKFEIINQYPQMILLEVSEWDTKEVPVEVLYSGTLGADYIAYKDQLELDRQTVTVTGPKETVDRIAKALVEVDLEGKVETIRTSLRYTLCDQDGQPVDAASIKTNAAEVGLTLKIQKVKELQLAVNVTYGGGATPENSSVILNYQTIKVAGTEKQLDSLEDILVLGDVDLSGILEDTVLTLPVRLPEGVENLSGITEVEASVTFPGLATKTLQVSKIFVSNVPVGMVAEPAKLVSVTIRGPEQLIGTITAENVSVLIDLTDCELGENFCSAQILLDTAYEHVGAIGSYNVLVTLTQAPEASE